jgi:hypothetical protein
MRLILPHGLIGTPHAGCPQRCSARLAVEYGGGSVGVALSAHERPGVSSLLQDRPLHLSHCLLPPICEGLDSCVRQAHIKLAVPLHFGRALGRIATGASPEAPIVIDEEAIHSGVIHPCLTVDLVRD